MAWLIEVKESAQRDLRKLDKRVQAPVVRFLREKVANADDPRQVGKPLKGDKKDLWRYRVGDYRIICDIEDNVITVLGAARSSQKRCLPFLATSYRC